MCWKWKLSFTYLISFLVDQLFFLFLPLFFILQINKPKSNPFVLHSPHQPDPNQTQNKPLCSTFNLSLRRRLGSVRATTWKPFSWFPFSIFAGIVFLFISFARIVFISLVRYGLVFLFSLLGLCFWSLYKLKPRRFDLAHQARASKTRYSTSNSSVLDSWC